MLKHNSIIQDWICCLLTFVLSFKLIITDSEAPGRPRHRPAGISSSKQLLLWRQASSPRASRRRRPNPRTVTRVVGLRKTKQCIFEICVHCRLVLNLAWHMPILCYCSRAWPALSGKLSAACSAGSRAPAPVMPPPLLRFAKEQQWCSWSRNLKST